MNILLSTELRRPLPFTLDALATAYTLLIIMFLTSPRGDHTYSSLNLRNKVQNNCHYPLRYLCMPTTVKLRCLRKNLTNWCHVLYEVNYPPRTGDTNAFEALFCPLQTVRVIIVYIHYPSWFCIFSVTALLQ